MGTSPAQRLMGRHCETLLLIAGSLLQPNFPTEDDTHKSLGTKWPLVVLSDSPGPGLKEPISIPAVDPILK